MENLYSKDMSKCFVEMFSISIEEGKVKRSYVFTGIVLFCQSNFAYILASNAYVDENIKEIHLLFSDKTEAVVGVDHIEFFDHFIGVNCLQEKAIDSGEVVAVEFEEDKVKRGQIVYTFSVADLLQPIRITSGKVAQSYTKDGSPVFNEECKFIGLCYDNPCGILMASTVESISRTLTTYYKIEEMGINEILRYIYHSNVPSYDDMASSGKTAKRKFQKDSNDDQEKCKKTKHVSTVLLQDRLLKLKSKHGKVQLGNIIVDMVVGGMRGMIGMLWETSLHDPEEGVHFRGLSIPESQKVLPTAVNGGVPLLESLLWLLLTRKILTKEQVDALSNELLAQSNSTANVCKEIDALPATAHPMTQVTTGVMALQVESEFQKACDKGLPKSKCWEPTCSDNEGRNVSSHTDQIKDYVWKTLKSGKVVPGFGHGVLRKTDPLYSCQREFALKHLPEDPISQLVSKLYEVVPSILTELGKVKNPWPPNQC